MRVKCKVCGEEYHDEVCWTICPHNPLDRAADAVYCKRHDLFECHICTTEQYEKDKAATRNAVNKSENAYLNDRDKVVATLQQPQSQPLAPYRRFRIRAILQVASDAPLETVARIVHNVIISQISSSVPIGVESMELDEAQPNVGTVRLIANGQFEKYKDDPNEMKGLPNE